MSRPNPGNWAATREYLKGDQWTPEQMKKAAARTGEKRSQAPKQANGSPNPARSPGRPSKLETRAWEWYSRNVTAATPPGGRVMVFTHAVEIATHFDQLWRERSE